MVKKIYKILFTDGTIFDVGYLTISNIKNLMECVCVESVILQ